MILYALSNKPQYKGRLITIELPEMDFSSLKDWAEAHFGRGASFVAGDEDDFHVKIPFHDLANKTYALVQKLLTSFDGVESSYRILNELLQSLPGSKLIQAWRYVENSERDHKLCDLEAMKVLFDMYGTNSSTITYCVFSYLGFQFQLFCDVEGVVLGSEVSYRLNGKVYLLSNRHSQFVTGELGYIGGISEQTARDSLGRFIVKGTKCRIEEMEGIWTALSFHPDDMVVFKNDSGGSMAARTEEVSVSLRGE